MLQPPIPIPPEQMEAERKKLEAEMKKQQQLQQQLEQQQYQQQQQQQQMLQQQKTPSVVVQSPNQNGHPVTYNDTQGSDLYSKGTYKHR